MKKAFIVILAITIFSCNKREIGINQNVIKELSLETINARNSGDIILPSKFQSITFFISTSNDEIIYTNINSLFYIYEKKYKSEYATFDAFLTDALNYKIEILKVDFEPYKVKSFKKNINISKNYNNKSFIEFFNNYCKTENNQYFIDSKNKNTNEILTIMYYLIKNGYLILEDDYLGAFIVEKWEDFLVR